MVPTKSIPLATTLCIDVQFVIMTAEWSVVDYLMLCVFTVESGIGNVGKRPAIKSHVKLMLQSGSPINGGVLTLMRRSLQPERL